MKKTVAAECGKFEEMPNIGKSIAGDLRLLGLKQPTDLVGRDPWVLYQSLCKKTKCRQDPCVLDVFLAAVRFMEGDPPHPWWHYTAERKRVYGKRLEKNSPQINAD